MWIAIILGIIIFLYLFLILPSLRKHPDKDLCKNLFVAHRGLHDIKNKIPENSLLSFEKAIEKGYAIEIDIHITKDDKVVIFHDDTLTRVCGKNRTVEEMTVDELSEYSLFDTDQKIPQLYELLEICNDNTVLVIEFKCTPGNYKRLCEKANTILNQYNVKYIVQSFNPLAVYWYRKNRKDICRGQLASNFLRDGHKSILEIICGFLLMNFLSRPDFISYNIKYPYNLSRLTGIIFGAIPAGWTIRSQQELDKCKKHNTIYIFEDFYPDN